MTFECLTIMVGVATVVNALALIYDVYQRYKKQSASFVQVPNKNEEGVEEFRTAGSDSKSGAIVGCIWIKSDGTVEIKRSGEKIEAYGRYIKWRSY